MLAIIQEASIIDKPSHLVFIVVKGSTSAGDRHNVLSPICLPLPSEKNICSCMRKTLSQITDVSQRLPLMILQ